MSLLRSELRHCSTRDFDLSSFRTALYAWFRPVVTSLWHCRHSARRCRCSLGSALPALSSALAIGACALGVRVVVTTTAVGDLSLWHCRHSARRCRCLVRHLRSWRLRSRRTRVATATAVGDLSLWSALSSPRTALYAWLRRPLPSHRSMLPPLRSTLTYCSRHLLTAVAPHGVYRSGRHCRHSVRHCRRCWYCRVLARFGTAGTQLGALACLRSLRLLALLAFVRVLRRPCDVR